MLAFKIGDFHSFTLQLQLFQIHAAVVTALCVGDRSFAVTCWYCTLNNHLDYATYLWSTCTGC